MGTEINLIIGGEAGQGIQSIAAGGSFVARGFSGDPDQLSELIQAAVQHRGFALIDVLQPCVSFNHHNTYEWYRERVYRLGAEHDPTGRAAAVIKANEWGEHIPSGIIYRVTRAPFEDRFPGLDATPPAKRQIDPREVTPLLEQFY